MKYDKVLMNGRTYTRHERAIEDLKICIVGAIGIFVLLAEWWALG